MRRRELITLLGGAAAAASVCWPLAARAQQPGRVRRIGVLLGNAAGDPVAQSWVAAFVRGLATSGWTDGRNVHIDYRWAATDLRAGAAELVTLTPDVILATSTPPLAALHKATTSVPIVFVNITDPVGAGFVASLAHPGGNITGFTSFEYAMSGKWLDMLREVRPSLTRALVILNPNNPQSPGRMSAIAAAALSLGVRLTPAGAHDAAEIERAVDAFAGEPNGGLLVLPDIITTTHRELIFSLAARHRLPAIYPFGFFAKNGGLMSYGIDVVESFRLGASYVDRILKGEKPGDLPVQAPTKFELIINLKTAKALGLDIPDKLLALADEVIE
jgi:putative tryptophan/tyrosine transport system substrate-binding protein